MPLLLFIAARLTIYPVGNSVLFMIRHTKNIFTMVYIILLNPKKIDKCDFIHSYVELDLQDANTYFDFDACYLINVCIL